MNNPLVSIITPCYNDGAYLRECVQCVKDIKYSNLEHIIINDGSTDTKTLDILNQLSKEEPSIKILHVQNGGVCKARNKAIAESSGKYIMPLDADDLISADYVSMAVDILENSSDVKVVTTNYKMFGERNKIIYVKDYSLSKLLGHNFLVNSSVYRRIDFDSVNGYNENMIAGLEDWDFFIKILETGGDVHILEGINYLYRIKERSKSRNLKIDDKLHEDLRFQIWENHREAYANNFVNPKDMFEYMKIVNSVEYRMGLKLVRPLKKLLNK